jgi:hypothetical protein
MSDDMINKIFPKRSDEEIAKERKWRQAKHQDILHILSVYLKQNPDMRFGQALFNLGINEFADTVSPENQNHLLRDIYNDSDEAILRRMTQNQ